MRTKSIGVYEMSVGIRQRVADRSNMIVLLELPARGETGGDDPYSMSPEDAIKLANKLRKMAKAAQT